MKVDYDENYPPCTNMLYNLQILQNLKLSNYKNYIQLLQITQNEWIKKQIRYVSFEKSTSFWQFVFSDCTWFYIRIM